jgi:hypothetical protein
VSSSSCPCGEFVLERLSDHFLTLLPERCGVVRIERVSADPFTGGADADVVRYDLSDMAVLAVLAADRVRGGNHAGPD